MDSHNTPLLIFYITRAISTRCAFDVENAYSGSGSVFCFIERNQPLSANCVCRAKVKTQKSYLHTLEVPTNVQNILKTEYLHYTVRSGHKNIYLLFI